MSRVAGKLCIGFCIVLLCLFCQNTRIAADDQGDEPHSLESEQTTAIELPPALLKAGPLYIVRKYGRDRSARTSITLDGSTHLAFVADPFADAAAFLEHLPQVGRLREVDLSAIEALDESQLRKLIDGCPALRRLDLPVSHVVSDEALARIVADSELEYLGLGGGEGRDLLRSLSKNTTLRELSLRTCTGLLADTELSGEFFSNKKWQRLNFRVTAESSLIACVNALKVLPSEVHAVCDVAGEWLERFIKQALHSTTASRLEVFVRPARDQDWGAVTKQVLASTVSASIHELILHCFGGLSAPVLRHLTSGAAIKAIRLHYCRVEATGADFAAAVSQLEAVSLFSCEGLAFAAVKAMLASEALRQVELSIPMHDSEIEELLKLLATSDSVVRVVLHGVVVAQMPLLSLVEHDRIEEVVLIGKLVMNPAHTQISQQLTASRKFHAVSLP